MGGPTAMTLFLIRHGESEGNQAGIVQGHLDMGLTQLGRLQSRQVGQALESQRGLVNAIVSSPLQRARFTAEIIAERLDLPLRLDDDLMEYDHGELSGLHQKEIALRFPEIARTGIGSTQTGEWPSIPGEEGRPEFLERVSRALHRRLEDGGDVIVVTHGGFINAACHVALGIDYLRNPARFRVGNCAITEFTRDRTGRWILKRHNDACHLGARTVPMEA